MLWREASLGRILFILEHLNKRVLNPVDDIYLWVENGQYKIRIGNIIYTISPFDYTAPQKILGVLRREFPDYEFWMSEGRMYNVSREKDWGDIIKEWIQKFKDKARSRYVS